MKAGKDRLVITFAVPSEPATPPSSAAADKSTRTATSLQKNCVSHADMTIPPHPHSAPRQRHRCPGIPGRPCFESTTTRKRPMHLDGERQESLSISCIESLLDVSTTIAQAFKASMDAAPHPLLAVGMMKIILSESIRNEFHPNHPCCFGNPPQCSAAMDNPCRDIGNESALQPSHASPKRRLRWGWSSWPDPDAVARTKSATHEQLMPW